RGNCTKNSSISAAVTQCTRIPPNPMGAEVSIEVTVIWSGGTVPNGIGSPPPALQVNVASPRPEFGRLGRHSLLRRAPSRVADVLRDPHRAELGATHRAEVGNLGPLGR